MARRKKLTNIQAVFNYAVGKWKNPQKRAVAIRKEYSKLRKQAMKSIRQIKEKYPRSDIARNTYFPTVKELSKPSNIYGAYTKVNQFLESGSSTLKGYERSRQETIKKLNESGYDNINAQNLDRFIGFMEDWKSYYSSQMIPSEYVAKVWEEGERLKLKKSDLMKNMDYYAQHLESLRNTKPIKRKGNKKFTRADYMRKIGKFKKWRKR